MKKKFLGLAFIVIVSTITTICCCGFGVKLKDISDADMNQVVFGVDNIYEPRFQVMSSVPYDTLTLAVEHTIERGFPAIQSRGLANSLPAVTIANGMAYASRDLPELITEGIIYRGGSEYDNSGAAAYNLMRNIYNKAGMGNGQGVTYEVLFNTSARMALDRGCVSSTRGVADYGIYVGTEYLDAAMVEFNFPLHIYVDAAEIVESYTVSPTSLNFASTMRYGNQIYAGYAYTRYRIVKDGAIHDEYLITIKNADGSESILRLGGQTSIYRIYGQSYVIY